MVLRNCIFVLLLLMVFSCKPPNKTCEDCVEEKPVVTGKKFFVNKCASCHGENGKLGNSGATDLSRSKITDEQIIEILNEGQGAMPPALELIGNQQQMDSVIKHIKSLRKK